MKTAEEVYRQITGCIINHGDIKTAMIEFAKMHVKAALEAANQKSRIKIGPNNYIAEDYLREEILVRDITNSNLDMWISVYKDSILNSYPESNIK
jgi:hypothetical protein